MKQKTIPPQVVINEKLGDFFIDIAKLVSQELYSARYWIWKWINRRYYHPEF